MERGHAVTTVSHSHKSVAFLVVTLLLAACLVAVHPSPAAASHDGYHIITYQDGNLAKNNRVFSVYNYRFRSYVQRITCCEAGVCGFWLNEYMTDNNNNVKTQTASRCSLQTTWEHGNQASKSACDWGGTAGGPTHIKCFYHRWKH